MKEDKRYSTTTNIALEITRANQEWFDYAYRQYFCEKQDGETEKRLKRMTNYIICAIYVSAKTGWSKYKTLRAELMRQKVITREAMTAYRFSLDADEIQRRAHFDNLVARLIMRACDLLESNNK